MNIFVTTDSVIDYLLVHELNKELDSYDLRNSVLLTTDRQQDKPFISYALMNGLEFKVYNIKDFLTEEVIKKIASNIDYLIMFSDMGNYFYKTLFSVCDKTIYIDGEKTDIDTYKKYLKINYEKQVKDKNNIKNKMNTYQVYDREVIQKLKDVKRVKIKIKTMGLNKLRVV